MIFRLKMPFLAAAAAFRLFWAKIRGFRTLSTPKEENFRAGKCKICPFHTENHQCSLCGCFTPLKVLITTEKCPDKRWGAIWKKKKLPRGAKK